MIKLLIFISVIVMFSACSEDKPTQKLDAKLLIEQKCASCHNLNMPPIVSDDELAPPMMAVAFHVRSFVTPSDESQRTSKAIEFVVDYVRNPALDKSFCDKDSLKRYGLMPSQEKNVSKEEAKAIASYMFEHFTQKNLAAVQEKEAQYNALSDGEKIALKYRCLGCHHKDKKIVGPSLIEISKKFENSKESIKTAIKNGSKGAWKESNGAVMPPFKQIQESELETLSEWILKFNS